MTRRFSKTARMAQELHMEPEILAKAMRDKSVTEIDTPLGKCAILRADDPMNGKRDGMNVSNIYDDMYVR